MGDPDKPWTVMIVDDDALIRRAVAIYLTNKGYQVTEAANGVDCLAKLDSVIPDVILLDVMMPPGMDGRETCRRIREFSEVPIILLSARAQEYDRAQGIAAGATGYITKPMSLREVEECVRSLLRPKTHGTNGPAASHWL
jgi:DNA-binding response OmpR family regulator